MNKDAYFSMCFKGDIREVKGNPFHIDTPYGPPVIVSIGDVFEERDRLEEELERAIKAGYKPSPPPLVQSEEER